MVASSSDMPARPLSGVRNSWLMLARNGSWPRWRGAHPRSRASARAAANRRYSGTATRPISRPHDQDRGLARQYGEIQMHDRERHRRHRGGDAAGSDCRSAGRCRPSPTGARRTAASGLAYAGHDRRPSGRSRRACRSQRRTCETPGCAMIAAEQAERRPRTRRPGSARTTGSGPWLRPGARTASRR